MKILTRMLSIITLLCFNCFMLFACGNNNTTGWLSPMMSVNAEKNKLGVYADYQLAKLNADGFLPDDLMESEAVTKATLRLSYNGEGEYKARINVRIDEIEVEEDGSMGHSVARFGVSKSSVSVLYYAQDTWFDTAYGSNAASKGDTLFDERFYAESDVEFSTTRRAILFNKSTAKNLSVIDFYIIGLIDGHYVLNFYIESADAHGHFHGLNKLALTSILITVGTPLSESNGES